MQKREFIQLKDNLFITITPSIPTEKRRVQGFITFMGDDECGTLVEKLSGSYKHYGDRRQAVSNAKQSLSTAIRALSGRGEKESINDVSFIIYQDNK